MDKKKSYLEVHMAVFIFGLTGLFGKFLNHSPLIIVFFRVLFSGLFIASWMIIKKETFKLKAKADYLRLVGMGILLAIHWSAFFASIQLSNVAIGLLTFSTFPVFVSFIKPMLFRLKVSSKEILFGFITLIGIGLILPFDDLYSSQMVGSVIGVFSGGVYAVFTIFNEQMVQKYSGRQVAFYEQVAATVVLMPSLFIIWPVLTLTDFGLLLLLGTLFTGVAHTLFINGLKHVSSYMASIITMLEPLYSIALAYVLLGETISLNVVFGGTIVLGTVLYLSLDQKKNGLSIKETV